ncbi:hypothetical protein [uncultured Bilophila sp.]|uniref:hypothetical protein n=1 Tax=uncultured Bilophila sp. TaxID=529385 RepID=UPI00280BB706|nr:hypothetical protein [uncultured Bilophila sp.]
MDEPNMEAGGVQQERQAKNEKPWKAYPPETYRDTIAELVHFSSKTVNSNAALAGVRLASDDALDAPYVSARTLMARGVSLSLDYGKGGAAVAGICKQVNAVVRGNPFAEAASPEERAAIENAMTEACSSAFSVGVEHVDHRLRQILIPKEGSEGGYVSMTPITAGGVCELLFERDNGLVPHHNAACEEEGRRAGKPEGYENGGSVPRMKMRKLRQAQFGIGGSNPQNVGGLVRAMQRPLFVDAPRSADDLRAAFSLYYKGISLDFSSSGPLRQALLAYADFRRRHELDNEEPSVMPKQTDLKTREEEEALLKDIAAAVLQRADEAREMLRDYAGMLPQERNPERGDVALVSPKLKPIAMRALLDPSLRDGTWPRDMAWLVIGGMERASYINGNRMLVLDVTATATVAGLLEEAFR